MIANYVKVSLFFCFELLSHHLRGKTDK